MIGHCTGPRTNLIYTKGKNVGVTIEFKVPQRPIFKHVFSTITVGQAKEVLSLQMLEDHGKELLYMYMYKLYFSPTPNLGRYVHHR
jgi:hypothetical protein